MYGQYPDELSKLGVQINIVGCKIVHSIRQTRRSIVRAAASVCHVWRRKHVWIWMHRHREVIVHRITLRRTIRYWLVISKLLQDSVVLTHLDESQQGVARENQRYWQHQSKPKPPVLQEASGNLRQVA